MKFINKLFYQDTIIDILRRKKLFSFMLLFDIFFILSIVLINSIIAFMIPNSYEKLANIFGSPGNLLIFTIIYTFIYFGLILLIYSFFKYCILDFIKSLFEKQRFTIKRLLKLYILNLKYIVIPIVLSFVLLFFISLSIERDYASGLFILIMIPILFFYYPFINLCHSSFYKGKNDIMRSLRIAFSPQKYYRIYLSSFIIIICYLMITFLLTLISKHTIFRNEELYHNFYQLFQSIYNIITFIFILILNAINRVAWFKI